MSCGRARECPHLGQDIGADGARGLEASLSSWKEKRDPLLP